MDRLAQVKFDENWSKDDVRKINSWSRQLTAGVNGQLTFAQNMQAEWLTFSFHGPVASISKTTSFKTVPKAVLLASLVDSNGVAYGVVFPWTFSTITGQPQIVTTAFASLSAGTYTATMLVIAG